MPTLQSLNLQLLKLQYREFLRKTAANHRGEGDNYYAIDRACVGATFEHSFDTLRKLATANLSELRAYYHARRERAKERLRRAIDAEVSRYLVGRGSGAATAKPRADQLLELKAPVSEVQPVTGSASSSIATQPTNDADLQPLYGTDGFLRRAVLYLVGHAARAVMSGLNATRIEGGEVLAAALERPAGQGLLTVSNHVAALDDPLVVAAMLPEEALGRPEALRWTLCATDRCFRYAALAPFFTAAKVLPVRRGGGLAQPGMAAAEARLAAGDWVHIFPEGTRSPDGRSLGAVRKGVGRLVAATPAGAPPPLLVPFAHRGMEDVLPRGAVLPATGQRVDVLVGEPIPVADLLAAARAEAWPEDRLHTAIAARVATALHGLTARLDARRAGLPEPEPPVPWGAAASGGGGGGGAVSSLDQFDPSDLQLAAAAAAARRQGGRVSAAWERLKFKMAVQYRGSWAAQALPAAAPAAGAAGGGAADAADAAAAAGLGLGLACGGAAGGAGRHVGAAGGGASPFVEQLLGLPRLHEQQQRRQLAGGRGETGAARDFGRWWA